MAETHFIDGAAKAPADFGEFGDYGEFKPIAYAGSYGDEGFYLDYKSSAVGTASSSTIGADRSGNTNHWSSTNITVSDQMIDTPSNNFTTLNPLSSLGATEYSEGNLKFKVTSSGDETSFGTIGTSSGKWYFEVFANTISNAYIDIGVGSTNDADIATPQSHMEMTGYYCLQLADNYIKRFDNGGQVDSTSVSNDTGDIIMIAYDVDNNKFWAGKDGTWLNSGNPAGGANAWITMDDGFTTLAPAVCTKENDILTTNFGQDSSFAGAATAQGNADGNAIGDFYYAPPSGFLALCTANLPNVDVIPSEHFNTVLYTGNGGTQNIAVGYNADFVWIKNRSENDAHQVFNSFTGATYAMHMDSTAVAVVNDDTLTAFISTGFSLGDDVVVNTNSESYVSWNWNFGNTTLGTGDFTQGSIASTCKRNLSAGMSLVQYTGTEANGTVGHGLSKAPDMFFIKSVTATSGWGMYHKDLGGTHVIAMNTTDGIVDEAEIFQDTAPSATLLTIGDTTYNNDDGETILAWCFHAVDGFSAFGTYNGNNNINGVFQSCSFRPALIIIKSIAANTPWMMFDSKRDINNPSKSYLLAEAVNEEATSTQHVDFSANGFKIRYAGGDMNTTNKHIWMAFAETPLKYSNAR